MYPVVYLMPAIIYNVSCGVVIFFSRNEWFRFLGLMLIFIILTLIINEILKLKPHELYRVIILTSFVVNTIYFFFILKNNKKVVKS